MTASPRIIGIDDWAWKKGHRYGTIVCDLERRQVIDLLPDREAATVEAWLADHPAIEIVSRDRGGAYPVPGIPAPEGDQRLDPVARQG